MRKGGIRAAWHVIFPPLVPMICAFSDIPLTRHVINVMTLDRNSPSTPVSQVSSPPRRGCKTLSQPSHINYDAWVQHIQHKQLVIRLLMGFVVYMMRFINFSVFNSAQNDLWHTIDTPNIQPRLFRICCLYRLIHKLWRKSIKVANIFSKFSEWTCQG